ncbi:MAG: creatininase family protein [Lautropia sp.]
MSRSRFWADLTTRDVQHVDRTRAIAVLPVAAIEQHGPHLPLDVDAALADAFVRRTAVLLPDDSPVLFLPTQAIGTSQEHARFAGTLSLPATTLIAHWLAIGASVAAAGIRKLVIFNTHGGNVSTMDIVGRELRLRHDMVVFSTSWFTLGLPPGIGDAHELRFGVHGGELETSLMLAIAPQRVDMQAAARFESSRERHARDFPLLGGGTAARLSWMSQDLNPQGATGNAAAATASKGEAILAHVAREFAALLAEVDRFGLDELRAGPATP